MLIRKEESVPKKAGERHTVWEYEFPYKDLGFATAYMDGRYPEQNQIVNSKCDEVYFVLDGNAHVSYGGKESGLEQGDLFFFEKGNPCSVDARNMTLILVTAPAWFPEQSKLESSPGNFLPGKSQNLVKKSNAVEIKNGPNCTVHEHYFPSKDLGFATADMEGRYPDKGFATNTACSQIYYVLEGQAKVHYEGKEYPMKAGDAFFFEKGKPYSLECRGLKVAVANAPAWYADQYKIVPEE
ncbi:MAG: cupin domain-containing protein [Candidatus Aenigmarchaeota archaeon]|nr:cupin domain-containing protein [Candidatus Aenigmarchaeota archaeon]